MTTPYYFGSFQLNATSGNLGYILLSKELPLPTVKPVTYIMSRRDGVKKSGETVDPRQITVTLKVIGTSRLDLISRLDTLQQALSLRGQTLVIHEDSRYYQNVDAISAPASFQAGNGIVQCEVPIVFICYDPYAYGATPSSYNSGTVVLTSSGSMWNFPAINLVGGGTSYSLPLITLTNKSTATWTSLTITQTQDSYSISAIATSSVPLPTVTNDYVTIQCDPSAVNGWTIITNNSGLYSEPLGLFPVIEPFTSTFNISIASTAGSLSAAVAFSWVPRYMS